MPAGVRGSGWPEKPKSHSSQLMRVGPSRFPKEHCEDCEWNCFKVRLVMSDDTESVSVWLDRLRAGDPAAAQRLWDRYFERLVGLARGKLAARFRRAADEEDVALS